MAALWAEEKRLKGELQRLRVDEQDIIPNASRDGVAGSILADRLADIH